LILLKTQVIKMGTARGARNNGKRRTENGERKTEDRKTAKAEQTGIQSIGIIRAVVAFLRGFKAAALWLRDPSLRSG
jgi:hypothetical protein